MTPIYTALLGLIFVWLSLRITTIRRGARIALGDGDNDDLRKGMRAQANFAEYTPFALLLLLLAELQGAPAWALHVLGLAFLAGRGLHAYSLLVVEPRTFRLRVAGMVLTFNVLIIGALTCLGLTLFAP